MLHCWRFLMSGAVCVCAYHYLPLEFLSYSGYSAKHGMYSSLFFLILFTRSCTHPFVNSYKNWSQNTHGGSPIASHCARQTLGKQWSIALLLSLSKVRDWRLDKQITAGWWVLTCCGRERAGSHGHTDHKPFFTAFCFLFTIEPTLPHPISFWSSFPCVFTICRRHTLFAPILSSRKSRTSFLLDQ